MNNHGNPLFTLCKANEGALLEIWHIGYGPNITYGLCVVDPNLYWTDLAERQPLIVRYGFPPGQQIECPGLVPREGSISQAPVRRAARIAQAHSSPACYRCSVAPSSSAGAGATASSGSGSGAVSKSISLDTSDVMPSMIFDGSKRSYRHACAAATLTCRSAIPVSL